jgi:hypothetical protein
MAVTITIRVEDNGATTSLDPGGPPASDAAEPAAEAPRPGLVEGPGEAIQVTGDSGEGPPPKDLSELGMSAVTVTAIESDGTPPEELVEGGESDEAEASEPMPVEDLEESKAKSTRSKKS